LQWAQQRLDPADVARIKDTNSTYTQTAIALSLMGAPRTNATQSEKDRMVEMLLHGP
jgi:hypothetical protein